MDFNELKRDLIKHEFSRMNNMQFEAVTTVKGPLLVLAGAGSGKTTVLVNRIAYMIKYGNLKLPICIAPDANSLNPLSRPAIG